MTTPKAQSVAAVPGAKMMYLIKRRPGATREDLVVNWFANHMPAVIQGQKDAEAAGKSHARRYIACLFQEDAEGEFPRDGVAQLWWDRALPAPDVPFGTTPSDTFQQKAEPYVPWATTEYVVMDGSERLRVEPNTLNAPFPCTRSRFLQDYVPCNGEGRHGLCGLLRPLVERARPQRPLHHGGDHQTRPDGAVGRPRGHDRAAQRHGDDRPALTPMSEAPTVPARPSSTRSRSLTDVYVREGVPS